MLKEVNDSLPYALDERLSDAAPSLTLGRLRSNLAILFVSSLASLACKRPNPEQDIQDQALEIKDVELAGSSATHDNVVQKTHEKAPEIIEGKIELPEIKFLDTEVSFALPPGITTTREAYHQAAENFASLIRSKVPDLEVKIKRNPKQKEELLMQFLDEVVVGTISEDPVLKPYFEPYLRNFGMDTNLNALTSSLKPIFIEAGFYFDFKLVANWNHKKDGFDMFFYPINKVQLVSIADRSNESSVPVLTLGERIFDLNATNDKLGLADSDINMALIFTDGDRFRSNIEKMIKDPALKPKDLDQASTDYWHDMVIHETTHVFLDDKFPTLDANSSTHYFDLDYSIVIGEQAKAKLKGEFLIIHLHELCSIGNEIAQSPYEFPLAYTLNGSRKFDGSLPPIAHQYYLASQALNLFTLKLLPDDNEKRELLLRFARQEDFDFIKEVVPKLSPELRRQIGTEMYKLGLELLTDIQGGKIQLKPVLSSDTNPN